MIFITKIELENFQSHKHTVMEFNRGLNVIVGNSDSGKTAILRAIKWALYNEPSGDFFIREGEKNVSVTLTFNTNAVVKRFRTPSKNGYYLKKSSGEEFTFDGFGIYVPKEIIDEIKINKINLDRNQDSIINIASQLEGPFLLNEKNSVRASAIGRLIGVNFVDDALRDTIKDSKSITSEIKKMSAEKEKLTEEISKFDYIKDREILLKRLEEKQNLIIKNKSKLSKLISLKQKYVVVKENIEEIDTEIKKYTKINEVSNKINILTTKHVKYINYLNLKDKFYNINTQIKSNKEIVLKYKNINIQKNIIYKLDNLILKNENISSLNIKYKQVIKQFKETLDILRGLDYLSELKAKLILLDTKLGIYNIMSVLNDKDKEVKRRIKTGNLYLNKYENISLLENKYNFLYEKLLKMKNLNKLVCEYKNILLEKKELTKEKEHLEKSISKLTDSYEELFLEIGICPLCFNEINKSNIEHIKMHFKEQI